MRGGHLQLGPDGNIYFAAPQSYGNLGTGYIGRITSPNTGGVVQTEPQNIQLAAYPFQNTGSFRGDFVGSGSVIGGVGGNGTMALFDPVLVTPIVYTGIKSMSFSDRDIAGVLQTSTYVDIKIGDQILLRNLNIKK